MKQLPVRLKPCPFCGGIAKVQYGYPSQQKNRRNQVFVKCTKCMAKTETVYQEAYEAWADCELHAVAKWNRRV